MVRFARRSHLRQAAFRLTDLPRRAVSVKGPDERQSMKIRHVVRGRCNPDNADGIIRHTYHLAHAQLRLGHDVAVYGLESKSLEPEVVDRDGLSVYAYPRTRVPFSVHRELVHRLDGPDSDVDLVHFQVPHDPHMYRLSRILQRRGIRYFVSPHAMWYPSALERHRIRKAVYKQLFDDRMNRGATGIHATAMDEIHSIHQYAPGVPAYVVRNALDLSQVDEALSDSNTFHNRWGLLPAAKIFLFLGRLDPYQKGLDVLLQAWSQAISTEVAARLVIIGPSWRGSLPLLTEMVDELGISDSVTFTGPLFGKDKMAALRSADCYVQLSRYEGSPYSIKEAFASGLPGILTRETNFATVAEEYGAGWTVTHDPRAVAERISWVMKLPGDQLQDAGKRARLMIDERHSIDRAASRMVLAYQAAMTGGSFENDD